MPTKTGLPKVGETWKRTWTLPPDYEPHEAFVEVLECSRGDYWSMRVRVISVDGAAPDQLVWGKPQLWVDCAHWMSKGELEYVGRGTS